MKTKIQSVVLYVLSCLHRDFEEESPCDWIDEAEKMFSEHKTFIPPHLSPS